ncbi:MAG: hypothetical protein KU38_01105 [Sulfurovum sp. FS08-3]|nr:MAG: hypothetical protein KU38_01105 [Sulfurovum sp. FS08-3]
MILERVDILLSTYNGQKYIKEQLDSIFDQSYKNFRVIVRDDGSSDATLEIVKHYPVEILESHENLGAKMSFATLLEYALHSSNSKYFMFADQDDIWHSNKIEKSVEAMKKLQKDTPKPLPLLVHSDLRVVDEKLNVIDNSFWHYSRIHPQYNQLNRLLMQNTVTGCTMLINRELANLSLPISNRAIMHDWWIAMVASAFGKIAYIHESTIEYRQHRSNEIGANAFSFGYVVKNIVSNHNLSKHYQQARAFLERYQARLDFHTVLMLERFYHTEKLSYLQRVLHIIRFNLFKQGLIRNIGLLLKA